MLVLGFLALFVVAACGGGKKSATTAAPTAPPAPAPAAVVPSPAPSPSAPAREVAPAPIVAPEFEAGYTIYNAYGFKLRLEGDVAFKASGWTQTAPDLNQGTLQFPFKGANAVLVWVPSAETTPQTRLAQAYNTLSAAQPSLTFPAISEGPATVSNQAGVYGGFAAKDSSGTTVGGGLIGTWNCPDSDRAFIMTVTAGDAATLQLRFQHILSSFQCSL